LIFIALGANLPSKYGTPFQTLQQAKKAMKRAGIRIVSSSRTWLTAPVPISEQPWFHNEVIMVETSLSCYALLEELQRIESDFGRVRTIRNAPRLLDLDLISYNNQIYNKPELIVPHPRMHQRAFVLLPMTDIVDDWTHPLIGMTLSDLIDNLPKDQKVVPTHEEGGVLQDKSLVK